jgi:hypothetical protein
MHREPRDGEFVQIEAAIEIKKQHNVGELYCIKKKTLNFRQSNLLSDELKRKLYESFVMVILIKTNLQNRDLTNYQLTWFNSDNTAYTCTCGEEKVGF